MGFKGPYIGRQLSFLDRSIHYFGVGYIHKVSSLMPRNPDHWPPHLVYVGMMIGFSPTTYTTFESIPYVEVCVGVLIPGKTLRDFTVAVIPEEGNDSFKILFKHN